MEILPIAQCIAVSAGVEHQPTEDFVILSFFLGNLYGGMIGASAGLILGDSLHYGALGTIGFAGLLGSIGGLVLSSALLS